MAGDRRTDIGTHDNKYSLCDPHDPCIDKADKHTGGSTGGLHQSSDQCTRKQSYKRFFRKLFQDILKFAAGHMLKTISHDLHAIEENRQTG